MIVLKFNKGMQQMTTKPFTKESFHSLPPSKQYALTRSRDNVLAKLRADEVSLSDIEGCRSHLMAHTVGAEYCVMIFDAHQSGVFDNAIAH
jgi:hypothetical protein